MSRVARIVIPGVPHHVTQRGNRRADVFETDADRQAYLRILKQSADKRGLSIWAYCLMPNHVHLIAVPDNAASLGQALHDAHTLYALYFNASMHQSGHLWQGRFYSCPMDETHLWAAVRYVETNPVRAGLALRAEAYRWSSAAAHCGLREDAVVSRAFPSPGAISNWADFLGDGREESTAHEHIRRQTRTGRPIGSSTFLDQLEQQLGRVVRPKRRGPQPGTRKQCHLEDEVS